MNMTWSLMRHFRTCVQEFENPQLLERGYMEYSLCGYMEWGSEYTPQDPIPFRP